MIFGPGSRTSSNFLLGHNGFIIEKAFVYGVICLSKWLGEKVFPKGIYGLWSPQAPSHMGRVGPKRRRRPRLHRERSPDGGGGRGSRVFIGSRQKKVYHHHLEHHYLEKFQKRGVKRCLNYQKPLLMNCPIRRSITTPPAWNSWLRALWWNSWFVVDITAFYLINCPDSLAGHFL